MLKLGLGSSAWLACRMSEKGVSKSTGTCNTHMPQKGCLWLVVSYLAAVEIVNGAMECGKAYQTPILRTHQMQKLAMTPQHGGSKLSPS